jgi:citrate lyase subunit beta/citryl-CoA lyase
MVVEALRTHGYKGKVRTARVNGIDSPWFQDDVRHLVEEAGDLLDCLVIPKLEGPEQVQFVDALLTDLETKSGRKQRLGLELQIESARGLEYAGAIAAASPRTEALLLGPADLAASLRLPELTVGGLKPDYPGDFWHYFLARVVVAARAHGLQPIDGPYAVMRDLEGLRTSAGRAAMLGCDGKWALNPAQVDVINEVFTPAQKDFDRAWAILDAYRKATDEEQTGAVMLGEEMIDEASRKMARVMVERGEQFGMRPSIKSAGRSR